MFCECIYRECLDSVFQKGIFIYEEGTIKGLGKDYVDIILPKNLYCEFPIKSDKIIDETLAYMLMKDLMGLLVINLYDIGYLIFSPNKVYSYSFSTNAYDEISTVKVNNIFSYNKYIIGLTTNSNYNFDIDLGISIIYTNSKNKILINNSIYDLPFKYDKSEDITDIYNGCVKLWRQGYEGKLRYNGVDYKFKIENNKIVI